MVSPHLSEGHHLNTVNSAPIGATAQEWQHFDLVLGLGDNMLPVVPDPEALPSEGSKVKAFGKIPSVYVSRSANVARGIAGWTALMIDPVVIDGWRADPRHGFCVRASAVRAIDVDVTDQALADQIEKHIIDTLASYDIWPPKRMRADSPKFLMPFMLSGAYSKRIIDTEHGRIEFLADGQQWVAAGAHPSGARYEWFGGLPSHIPALMPHIFEELWDELQKLFGRADSVRVDGASRDTERAADGSDVLRTITPDVLGDLREALGFEPLRKEAGDNGVWSEVGYALLSLGAQGRELFQQFSAEADNFKPGDPERWWAEHEGAGVRSDYRHAFTMARRLGWRAQADLDAFPICEPSGSGERTETESGYNDRGREGDAGGGGAFTLSPAAAIALREGTVPEAFNLCTDQANATRLSAQFGHALKCIAGTFYYYSGTHWEKNEGAAARCAANLGAIVKVEADAARAKFESLLKAANEELTVTYKKYEDSSRPEQSKAGKDLQATDRGRELITTAIKANSLEKWQKHCEMLPTQQKALTLLRSLLTLDTAFLDTHHHLFNCPNGTINLITGEVTAHDPKQYITRMAPTSYNPEAKCPEFEKFLVEVLDEERANFLQRWFGYGITGETREQKVVLHIGDGSNGKGTLFRLLDATVGKSYLHTAAPNLLTGDASNRHSTEIADLFGRRMVVAHESDADAALREGFIKQASGEDQLSGRYLYKDHFQFTPTFKLQLLTNHEPTVKGSDFGIWRRLLLVRYAHKYGTAEQVATGDATRLADLDLTARLLAEREGILAWMVAGAREWYATRLRPPASVVNDSALYRTNQDRMRKFVADRCTMDEKAWSPFTNGMGALYPAYVGWCKESGFAAMGLTKFGAELTRAAPGTHTMQQFRKVGGRTKPFTGIKGLRLDSGDIDGSFPITDNGDLI